MAMYQAPHEIKKGDLIKIKAQGITVIGEVYSAEYYDPEGYYIEVTRANVPGGFSYWKQRYDGGKIVSINGKNI